MVSNKAIQVSCIKYLYEREYCDWICKKRSCEQNYEHLEIHFYIFNSLHTVYVVI